MNLMNPGYQLWNSCRECVFEKEGECWSEIGAKLEQHVTFWRRIGESRECCW